MPRRRSVNLTRDVGVDSRFRSSLIQKLINVVMEGGKKAIARRIVYDALDLVAKKIGGDEQRVLSFFNEAFDQIVPNVEVRPRRVGGSVYQVPMEVRPSRRQALGIRWLIKAAASRSDKSMGKRLASEILEAHGGRGNAVRKKVDVHKMADSNRAFSHYAW